jgi:hypothetical protein
MTVCRHCGARRIEGWQRILIMACWTVVFTLVFTAGLVYVRDRFYPEPTMFRPNFQQLTYG